MVTKPIPASYQHTCDNCGVSQSTSSQRLPDHWVGLVISQDGHDFQGAAVGDATVKRDLCADCAAIMVKAINDALAKAK